MMHEDKQAAAFIAEASTNLCGFRDAARSTQFKYVQNHAAETSIVIVECGPSKQTVLKPIPVMNQFLTARGLWKPTGDALSPILGYTGDNCFNPNDDRITSLTFHRFDDKSIGNDVHAGLWWRVARPGS
jgi:hypothetical protein